MCNAKADDETQSEEKSGLNQKRSSRKSSGNTKWKSLNRLHNLEVKEDTSSIRLNSFIATHSGLIETEEL